ncbi:hypothetical protein [Methanobrevibacter sp. DSM 116169]|uniref:hypothetical protein n=1 Tax=Methanobrevibacter sp. DSM 116169 TaxID=3242727 RepID=UPI0038FC668A
MSSLQILEEYEHSLLAEFDNFCIKTDFDQLNKEREEAGLPTLDFNQSLVVKSYFEVLNEDKYQALLVLKKDYIEKGE